MQDVLTSMRSHVAVNDALWKLQHILIHNSNNGQDGRLSQQASCRLQHVRARLPVFVTEYVKQSVRHLPETKNALH
jgi:hypothetical protein